MPPDGGGPGTSCGQDEMKRVFLSVLAAVCIVLGLMTIWLPIPTGVPLIATGLFILLATHSWAARMLRRARRSFFLLDGFMTFIEERADGRFSRVLRRSRPRRGQAIAGPEAEKRTVVQ